jgi:hypothetical protein
MADRMDTDMDYPSFDLQSTHISFEVEFISSIKTSQKFLLSI